MLRLHVQFLCPVLDSESFEAEAGLYMLMMRNYACACGDAYDTSTMHARAAVAFMQHSA